MHATIGTIGVWDGDGADEITSPVSPDDHKPLDATLDHLGCTVSRWERLPRGVLRQLGAEGR